MTVEQKVQTIDFWIGRTIFKYGDESGNPNQFALPSKNRPGPHRDKRDAKNEKKSQTLKNIETATENENGCITKPINLVRYDSICLRFWNLVLMHSVSWLKLRKINCQLSPSRSVKQGSLDLLLMRRRLQPIASKILMKTFFATRMARPDFLRATQSLASQVTKWLCTDM
jgi:hypothetical protein